MRYKLKPNKELAEVEFALKLVNTSNQMLSYYVIIFQL